MTEFRTKNFSFASFLRYVGVRHIGTTQTPPRGMTFIFLDDGRCTDYREDFFSAQGAAVADARALLECARDVKESVSAAIRSTDGSWLASEEPDAV